MRIVTILLFFLLLAFSTFSHSASYVRGYIDHAGYVNGNFIIRGWACQTTDSQSIRVHVYAGGPAGQGGTFITHGVANLNSEVGVANACSSQGTKHRFKLNIPADKAFDHSNKTLYVHGISTRGTGNKTIQHSGTYRLPTEFDMSYLKAMASSRDLKIKSNQTVNLDTNASTKLILVQGNLVCVDDFTLKTEGILVVGSSASLQCGTATMPFASKAEFVVTGNRDIRDIDPMNMIPGEVTKAVMAMQGGKIHMYGKTGKSGYAKLSGNANVGVTSIRLDRAVSWQSGDQIVIAPTDFDPFEAEQRTITSLSSDKKTIYFSSQLNYKHWGQTERHGSWTLDQRAEVINLTRNIKVMSDNDSHSNGRIGAHMMIMGNDSAGYIDNVEFYKVGQQGKLGRYPFHWHKKGDVNGQFITRSSIHKSFNRCVVVHETDYAKVEHNSCYDHFGHGYFLEEGDEIKNSIKFNIGILSRKVPKSKEILISEVDSTDPNRFPAPATFWISNPDNNVSDNIAAGSEGSGFWMSFRKTVGSATPLTTPTLAFNNNKAHSSIVGITHDGAADGATLRCSYGTCVDPNNRKLISAFYNPTKVPIFRNLVAYKNALAGIYYRGSRADYANAILADNGRNAWFAYDQGLVNSLVVGYSKNHNNDTLANLKSQLQAHASRNNVSMPFRKNFSGMMIYDGPFFMSNVRFSGYPSSPVYLDGDEVTPSAVTLMGGSARYTNLSQNIQFAGAPYKKVTFDYDGNGWGDAFSAAVTDVDGTLAGTASRVIMADHPFNDDAKCATGNASLGFDEILICNYKVSHFRFGATDKVNFTIKRIASNGSAVTEVSNPHQHFNKFPLIQGSSYTYEVSNFSAAELQTTRIQYSSDNVNDVSPVILFKNMPSACNIRKLKDNRVLPKRTSLSQLKATNDGGYFRSSGNYYIKVEAYNKQTQSRARRGELSNGRTDYLFKC